MKQLITLILSFSIFSCNKNDPQPFSEEHTEQEIFDALTGIWHPSRLAYDENFKQIVYMIAHVNKHIMLLSMPIVQYPLLPNA